MKVDVRHKRYLKYQLTMQDLLFWIAYIPWMFSWMLTYTWLKPIIHPYGIGKIWTLIGIILLFLRAIYVRNSGFFMVSLIGIMLFITFLVRLGNDNVNFILYTIILILSVGDMEVDDIVKVTFYLQVILLCITVLPAAIGIIHNEAQYSENGVRLRHLLGFRYCTDSANFYLSIILEYIYLYRKKGIGIIKTIIFISIGYYIYAQTDTKEAFLLVILAFIMERLLRPFDFRRSYTLRAIIKYQYWGYALVSIISSILYVKNGALEKINVALNSRLDLAHRGLMKWGVKIFGVSVKWISKGSTYNYIPNVYHAIFESMKQNDVETARAWQMKSIRTVEVIIKYGGGVRGGKAIMKLIGIDCGSCRLPIKPFSIEEYDKLKGDLDAINFFDF